jgi:hypothetical protein
MDEYFSVLDKTLTKLRNKELQQKYCNKKDSKDDSKEDKKFIYNNKPKEDEKDICNLLNQYLYQAVPKDNTEITILNMNNKYYNLIDLKNKYKQFKILCDIEIESPITIWEYLNITQNEYNEIRKYIKS